MTIELQFKVVYGDKEIECLRVYLNGSGDPKEEHQIVALSLGAQGLGIIPDKVDRIDTAEDIAIQQCR